MPNPSLDVANYLSSAGIGLTLGANLFEGPIRPVSNSVPAQSVFVSAPTGGFAPERTLGRTTELRRPVVQVRVRSPAWEDGQSLAQAVFETLENADIPGYLDVVMAQSQPMFIGEDENGNYHWSMDVELLYQT